MKELLLRIARVIASLLVLVLSVVGISIFVCSFHIKVTNYEVTLDGLRSPVRLVVVADLHGKVYGQDNDSLVKKVAAQNPDGIVLLGDLFPSLPKEDDRDYVIHLTRQMQDLTQVYFAMGNHEAAYTSKYGRNWIEAIAETGAFVLEESWDDYSIADNMVRLGSTLGHGFLYGRSVSAYKASPEYAVLSALEGSPYPPHTSCAHAGHDCF